jgi:hypothetical protein
MKKIIFGLLFISIILGQNKTQDISVSWDVKTFKNIN